MIHRIFQVEIAIDDDNPDECYVWFRDPRKGAIIASVAGYTADWVPDGET